MSQMKRLLAVAALWTVSEAVILSEDQPIHPHNSRHILYCCLGNKCRSAAMDIFSKTVSKCINEYKTQNWTFDSFAVYNPDVGATATPYLLDALGNAEKFLDKIKNHIKREINEDEKKCFKDSLAINKKAFKVQAVTPKAMEKPNMQILAANQEVVDKLTNDPLYKNIKGNKPEITLMTKEGIKDDAWMVTQLVETYIFRRLLEEYPGAFEKETGPFQDKYVQDRSQVFIYETKNANRPYIKYSESTQQVQELTAEHVGFIYHDLISQDGTHSPEFEEVIKNVGPAVGWEDADAETKDGTYKKHVFPRPRYFDKTKLIHFLETEGNTVLAEQIKEIIKTHIVGAYEDMASNILDVVLQKLG